MTHIESGEGSAAWWPTRVGNTHDSTQTIVPDPLSITLPVRGCSVQTCAGETVPQSRKCLINLLCWGKKGERCFSTADKHLSAAVWNRTQPRFP